MTEVRKGENDERIMRDELAAPKVVDRSTFQAELDPLGSREGSEGNAIAAARLRLPMVEVDGATPRASPRNLSATVAKAPVPGGWKIVAIKVRLSPSAV
jgi:hypothetical protein